MEGKGKAAARNNTDAWRAFMFEFRPAYKEKHPSAKATAVNKAGSRKWKAMSMEEKDRFFRESAATEEQNQETTEVPRVYSMRNIPNICNYPELGPEEWFRSHPDYKYYRTIGGVGPVNVYLTSSQLEYGFY